jgi:hypothetical protein
MASVALSLAVAEFLLRWCLWARLHKAAAGKAVSHLLFNDQHRGVSNDAPVLCKQDSAGRRGAAAGVNGIVFCLGFRGFGMLPP